MFNTSFSGTLEVSFTTEDMVSFQKDLENIVIYNNVGKEIGFFSLDDDFAIKMKLANTGSVETYGVINSSLNGTSSLNFKFTSNLPYMDNLLNRLKTLVEQYPVNNIDEKN